MSEGSGAPVAANAKTARTQSFSPTRAFLKKFLRQRVAVVALVFVLAIVLIALLAPYLVPYDPDRPVTLQYAAKGISVDQLSCDTVTAQLVMSDGSRTPFMVAADTVVESGNRRVVTSRPEGTGAIITSVGAGETYVRLGSGTAASVLRACVARAGGEPLLSQLRASLSGPLMPGGSAAIAVMGLFTDGATVSDRTALEAAAVRTAQLKGRQDSSGGWGEGDKGLDTMMEFESLTPTVATVDETGTIRVIARGVGRVRVSLGEVVTTLAFATDGSAVPAYPVGVELSKTTVKLADIYKHQPPSRLHWFGTDHQNRDIFSRVLMGTRQTLMIGFISVAIGAVLGTLLGLLAGYHGGWVDTLLSRASDVLLAFPGNLLAIAVIAVLGPGIINIIFSVAVYTVPIFLRIVRGSTLEVKSRTYVEAARSIGVRDWTIIMRHIFPGTLSVVMVYLTMRIGTAILIGASLSFLGLGGDITAPEWGAMLSAAKDNSPNVFHPTLFPGLAIMLTVLSFNLLGDGLRDALDPKLKD